ncbi:MAG TPA: GEVED domain-containing protein, partial [Flavobacteriales bacterium]|nr:GEVED domain-containing protein [Flavobacteriales bacterium]
MKMNPNPERPTRRNWRTRLASLLAPFALIGSVSAQTVSTTVLANNNGSSVAVFSFLNTTPDPIIITEIGSIAGATSTYTAHLYARVVPYNTATGDPGAITAVAGWTAIGTNSNLPLTANTTTSATQQFITGMNYTVPGLTQVQLAVQLATGAGLPTFTTTAGSLRYSTVGAQQNVFNNAGIEIRLGTNYGYAGTMGAPTNTPRGFIGYINYMAAMPCAGQPAPGNTLASVPTACSGANFNLSLQNPTTGLGVNYQWEYADDAAFTVNVNSFGTNAPTQITNLTSTRWYRCTVTCTNSGLSGTSTPVQVTLNGNSCACITYAASNATNTGDTKIDSVKVNGVGFGSLATACEAYTFTTSSGISLQQGATAVARIRNGSCSLNHYTAYYSLYADFNGDGDFADVGETLGQGGPTTALNSILDFNISVPPTANVGPTRFRAVITEGAAPPPATGTYAWGETEDFCVNITAQFACSGQPAPGNTLASVPTACSGANFNLSLQNPLLGSGTQYQWQYADDQNFTVNVTNFGTDAPTQTTSQTSARWYRCIVTCTNSGLSDISAPVFVDLAGAAYCAPYCTTNLYTTGTASGDLISNVVITGTTLSNNTGFVAGTPAYTFYLPNPPSNTQTATLQAGSSYSLNVSTGEWGNQGFAAWIDYNDDGIFDTPSERVGATPGQVGSGYTAGQVNASTSFPISLACNPPLGAHRMRIRCVYNVNGVNVLPCNTETWGEVEDYIVTITAADPCPAPIQLTAAATTATTATLGWTLGCAETEWDVHFQAAGGGAPVTPSNPGLTTTSLVVNTPTPGAYEFYVRAVCGGLAGESGWAGPYVFFTNDECAGAIPLTVFPGGGCPAGNVQYTTTGFTASNVATTCLLAGLTDAWFTFNSGNNTTIVWNVTLGTMGAIGVQVTSDCLGTE